MKKTLVKGLALAVVGGLMMAGSAMALPTLQISATGVSGVKTIVDGDSYDIATANGIVSWLGDLGNFSFALSAGSTAPAIGSFTVPSMHLTGFANTGTNAGGTFTVKFSEIGYGPMDDGLNGFVSAMNGAGGTQDLHVYYDTTNTLFGMGTEIADLNTLNTDQIFSGIPANSPFSLTMVATITEEKSSAASFDNTVAPVPEPATMLLLGTGLIGLAGVSRRRKAKKA